MCIYIRKCIEASQLKKSNVSLKARHAQKIEISCLKYTVPTESLCPLFFIKFLFFTKWKPFKNYEKCFTFLLKTFYCSGDIQIFANLSSLFFFPVSHCFKGWFKKNSKFYDAILWCLNKNLITHDAWHLEKEIRCDIETLFFDRVLNTKHFNGTNMQKMCTKS